MSNNALREQLRSLMDKVPLRATGTALVTHRDGSLRLDDFPELAYSPKQWGEGVRVASNGAPVEMIAADLADSTAEEVAREYEVSVEAVAQAVAFLNAKVEV
jgi:hypothetical protein